MREPTPERFRALANRVSVLLGAEALRDLPTVEATVDTPLGPATCRRLATDVVMAPVLRAGLGMLPGMLELVPNARVGHIGLQRDERTAVASQYYAKLPPNIRRQLCADDRSDAGDRRQRRGGTRHAVARRRTPYPPGLHRRRA